MNEGLNQGMVVKKEISLLFAIDSIDSLGGWLGFGLNTKATITPKEDQAS